jgi:hypothetical protein
MMHSAPLLNKAWDSAGGYILEGVLMKDAYEVLSQKEADLVRVHQEIESLKVVASLLAEEPAFDNPRQGLDGQNKKPSSSAEMATSSQLNSEATGTIGAFSIGRRPGFWNSLRRRS